jgi:hypothetical protein
MPITGRTVALVCGLTALLLVAVVTQSMRHVAVTAAQSPVVQVYKSITCGCCSEWVEHLREAGFTVHTTDTSDLRAVKAEHRVPRQAESCHTAIVDGYVVEGHVPATDVLRLLEERPAVRGLAVPGMPIGSPGMEVEGLAPQPYDVLAFDDDGTLRTFTTYR